ncbi:hypothetical protein BLS_006603 [Venturia inaequalis]|uniref:Uncharacterized protein n=1 Tax=Venturia inaequalis TaxID=5025 RepID=A0A8H3V4N8_VENIN|nr:hypothetical protein EG328_010424 [Venturia inaequalis]KAE9973354.1 hypothetical protein EG327_009121 [Venturia inaequalis]KAE9982066.1 hypothetical protein BLS_006603 [Venturia inaequalis]
MSNITYTPSTYRCEKIERDHELPTWDKTPDNPFLELSRNLRARISGDSGMVNIELEFSNFSPENLSDKLKFWDEFCKNLSKILEPNTSITFSFIDILDLNQLQDLLQSTTVLPPLANVRIAVGYLNDAPTFTNAVFLGLEQGFAWKIPDYYEKRKAVSTETLDETVDVLAYFGRKLVSKATAGTQHTFPWQHLPPELRSMALSQAVTRDHELPLRGGIHRAREGDLDFYQCCGSCGGYSQTNGTDLCFCRGDSLVFSTSCTCAFPCNQGPFAANTEIAEESRRVFLSRNHFSLTGPVRDVLADLEDARPDYLSRMRNFSFNIDAIPGYWPSEYDPDYYEREWQGLWNLLGAIPEHFHPNTKINLCFSFLDRDRWTKRLAQFKNLRRVCDMVSDRGLANVTILIENIFIAHPDLETYEDGRQRSPIYKVKVFGPGVKIKLDQLQSLVDPENTLHDYVGDDCDYD